MWFPKGGKHRSDKVSKSDKKVKVKGGMVTPCGVVSKDLIAPIKTESASSFSDMQPNSGKVTPHEAKMAVKQRDPGMSGIRCTSESKIED